MIKHLLAFLFFSFVYLCSPLCTLHAATVHVATAGTLSTALTSAGINTGTVTSLTITGKLNSTDFGTLSTLATSKCLADIDLSGAVIAGNAIPSHTFGYCDKLKSIILPNSVTSIGSYAFSYCTALTSITIPNSVTTIGDNAYSYCTALTSVTIPNSVTSIGNCAFLASSGSVTVNTANPNYSSEDGVLFNKDKTTLIYCPSTKTKYSIPTSVTKIEHSAFFQCTALTSVTIPNSVTTIEDYTFCQCYALASVTIPNSVTTIGNNAFSGCPTGLTVNEYRKTAISIYNSDADSYAFDSPAGSKILHVPAGSKGSYTAKNWGDCFTITDDLPATGTLSVSPTNVSLANTEGSTATVTINSNIHWRANITSGVAWLTIDPYSAAASSNTLTITAAANTSATVRTGTITVATCDDAESLTITVTQAGTGAGASQLTVTTQGVTTVSQYSATGNGTITSLGSINPTAYGICYSNTNTTPTIGDSQVNNGAATTTGPFTAPLTNLTPNTTYYARAYATNAASTVYGNVVSFNTLQVAPVISYPTPSQMFSVGTTATILTPSNSGGAVPPTIPNEVTTFAGSSAGYANGNGTEAKFDYPYGVATDAAGNIYVGDIQNNRIRKITPNGVVTTLAGSSQGDANGSGTSAQFRLPSGVATDAAGNVFVTDRGNYKIRKITPDGTVSTLAGSSQGLFDAIGTSAKFQSPWGIACDLTGNMFVADEGNHIIRKITTNGTVTTFAGSSVGDADGDVNTAKFHFPTGVATDAAGNIIVVDYGNNKIRKIAPDGMVSTIAGSSQGYADGTGTSAKFHSPDAAVVDQAGNIFVTDRYNHKIRKIAPDGTVTTIAGSSQGNTDGIGSSAQFNYPMGIAIDATGNLFVADESNNRIRKITPYGYTISPALPAGLTFDAKTGAIGGTPTATSAAKTYTITGSNIAGSSSATIVMEVSNKRKLTVNTPNLTTSKGYDRSNTAIVTAGAITNKSGSDDISVSATARYDNASVGSGKTITVSYTISGADTAKYAAPDNYVVNNGEIKARKLTIKNIQLLTSKTYDGTTLAAGISGTFSNAVMGDDVKATAIATYDNANAGTAKTITVKLLLSGNDAANYAAPDDYVENNGEITPKAITVTARTTTKIYGASDPPLSYTVSPALVGTDAFTGKLSRTPGEDVGNYAILQGTLSAGSNYTIFFVSKNFSISPKTIAITVTASAGQSKVYGDADPVLTYSVSPALKAGDTFTGALVREAGENVGNYAILQGTLSAGSNYTITFVSKDFAITPKAITVTANAGQSKVYGDSDPALTYTVSPALLGTDEFTGNLLRAAGKNVGNYAISLGTLSAGNNYTLTFVGNEFAITPKQLTTTLPSVATNKFYDGNTKAQIGSLGSLTGAVASDVQNLSLSAEANYNDASVGSNKTITIVYSLSGNAASNYLVPVSSVIQGASIQDKITLASLSAPTPSCLGNDILLNYQVLSGMPDTYTITFESQALSAGFSNKENIPLAGSNATGAIAIKMPSGIAGGTYTANLKMKGILGNESPSYPFTFTVNLSTDYLTTKFNDVILFDNTSNRFNSFLWYKDGLPIEGATMQFYNDPEGLSGSYSVSVTTTTGEKLRTCDKVIVRTTFTKPKISVYPNPVKRNESATVSFSGIKNEKMQESTLIIYNTNGEKVYVNEHISKTVQLRMNLPTGIYLGNMLTSNNEVYSFKMVIE